MDILVQWCAGFALEGVAPRRQSKAKADGSLRGLTWHKRQSVIEQVIIDSGQVIDLTIPRSDFSTNNEPDHPTDQEDERDVDKVSDRGR